MGLYPIYIRHLLYCKIISLINQIMFVFYFNFLTPLGRRHEESFSYNNPVLLFKRQWMLYNNKILNKYGDENGIL
ncbi:hypothetical protein A3F02_01385 [Candidatus Curtissbacteria bacterium RIFCSPHIGHO2_12_FULL_38_9b]|uniref:Uncharacterized protein n=2 Tax=Candidatus Curtissiibacteriota TaxID=1752717 RepID=A0A1F5GTS2_9BACT|nr:MAG: hypothetical protein A3F02_01385 [Candidatus Curtissbacteria bacterium RIFCSPHIGHO2_12_FULL_38_9b]OGD95930.1 MAG: hypothetical protein A3A48_03805 [Candidatus Curtissbacteria bacterium RIFCSPLOWO2_01_FULL_37_9]